MIRVLLAGQGLHGRQWAAALRSDSLTELVGVADGKTASLADLDDPTFPDMDCAMDLVPVDAIILATPPAAHAHDV